MAYAATVTWTERRVNGRKELTIKAVETEARDTSSWRTEHVGANTVTNQDNGLTGNIPIYKNGTITLYTCKLTSGTGTTVLPAAGKAAGFSVSSPDEDLILLMDTAAPLQIEMSPARYDYEPVDVVRNTIPIMYFKSGVNDTTTDHTITSIVTIVDGHI